MHDETSAADAPSSEAEEVGADLAIACFFNPADVFAGGAERYAWGEAELLAATRRVVFVSASRPVSDAPFRQVRVGGWSRSLYQPPGPRRNPIKLVVLHLLNLFNPGVFVESLRLFRRLRPKVVHTHNLIALSPAIWLSARLAGARVIHTHQDQWLLCERATMTDTEGRPCNEAQLTCMGCRALRPAKRLLTRGVDVEVFPSRWLRQSLRRQGPLVPSFSTSGPPVDTGAARTFTSTAVYVGALTAHKLGPLLEAFALAAAAGSDMRLVIAGRGPLESKVAAAAESSSNISYLGQVDTHARDQLLQEASVLVIPSTCAENSPLVFFEALVAGVPVIGSDIGGLTELQEWRNMVLVPPGDAQALADALIEVLGDEDRLAALRAHGLERRDEALPDRFVRQMEGVIANLEARGRTG